MYTNTSCKEISTGGKPNKQESINRRLTAGGFETSTFEDLFFETLLYVMVGLVVSLTCVWLGIICSNEEKMIIRDRNIPSESNNFD